MSLPGVQTEKTLLAERDAQIRQKQHQKAVSEIREAEDLLKHYEGYKLGGDSDPSLDALLRQKRAEIEAKKRALGVTGAESVAAPGAPVSFDMNMESAGGRGREGLFAQGGAHLVGNTPPSQESERDRRLRLRAEERARRLTGNPGSSAYGNSEPAYPPATSSAALYDKPAPTTVEPLIYAPRPPMPDFKPPAFEPKSKAYDPFTQPLSFDSMPSYDQPHTIPEPKQQLYGQPPPYVNPTAYTSQPQGNSDPREVQSTGKSEGYFAMNSRGEDDKKEKQRRYREELDRQQAEKRPPRPPQPSVDVPMSSDPPPLDDKREKQRRYREELDRIKAQKAAMSEQEGTRTRSHSSSHSSNTPAPFPPNDRSKEIEKQQNYARELAELVEAKARSRQKNEDFIGEKVTRTRTWDSENASPREEDLQRLREIEKKQKYAQELREAMEEKARNKQRKDEYPVIPGDFGPEKARNSEDGGVDPALERKKQYKMDLERQMEEQKRRKEEEKRAMKEKMLREEEEFLREMRDVKKTGKAGVTDPNRTVETGAKGEEKRVEVQERPIGVAMKPVVKAPETPVGQGLGTRKGLFEPVEEPSRPYEPAVWPATGHQAFQPPALSTPMESREARPEFQYFPQSTPPLYAPNPPMYAQTPTAAFNQHTYQLQQEIAETRKEHVKAKEAVLELRAMMLEQKEKHLDDMIQMHSAQLMQRPAYMPPVWPGYPPAPQYAPPVYPDPAFMQVTPNPPQELSFPNPPQITFPGTNVEPFPETKAGRNMGFAEEYRPREQTDWMQTREKLDIFEHSMAGTSRFVDPGSVNWGTTNLLASVQKPVTPSDSSLQVPVNPQPTFPPPQQTDFLQIQQIPEEEEYENPPRASLKSVERVEEASGSVELGSYKAPELSDRPVSGPKPDTSQLRDSNPSIKPRARWKPVETSMLSSESLSTGKEDPPPRTSSASGKNRPKTLEAFKERPQAKVPAKRQIQADTSSKKPEKTEQKPTPVQTPKENKPSFHRLQDLRNLKKQEKPRDVLDNLQDELERLHQQRQNADQSSLESSSSASQSQFEGRFKLVAMSELKR